MGREGWGRAKGEESWPVISQCPSDVAYLCHLHPPTGVYNRTLSERAERYYVQAPLKEAQPRRVLLQRPKNGSRVRSLTRSVCRRKDYVGTGRTER